MKQFISLCLIILCLCLSVTSAFAIDDNDGQQLEWDIVDPTGPNSSEDLSNNPNQTITDSSQVIDTVNDDLGIADNQNESIINNSDNTGIDSVSNSGSTTDSNTGTNTGNNTGDNTGSNTVSNTNSNTGSNDDNDDRNPGTGSDINKETNNNNAGNPTSPSSSSESSSSSQGESSITYSDVDANKWYSSDVAKATELGLINGYDGKFYPDNNLTYSEAIKLAACMHQLKTTGKVTLVNGTKNWYDTYVEYAKQNKIISKDYDWTANATRAGYVEIFAHSLPDDALIAKNIVADGAIPDVAMSDYAASEIYKLYRAGILNGSDAKGTFNPNSNILRCEVAAILTRMMDESARKTITLA